MNDESSGDELLEEIRRTRGFVESFHRILAKYDTSALSTYSELWSLNFQKSRLDIKTVSLIRLAVVAALRDSTAVGHSFDQAMDNGASVAEAVDAIKISAYFSGILTMVDSMKIIEEKLKKNVD
jgi:alkylhydroperoxidase/carboxymuconolactone decarboxylase family protein YurZ